MIKIELYIEEDGKSPFETWIKSFKKDKVTQGRILDRIRRFENGNFGDHKMLGDGIYEHRIDSGKGFRIYYGWVDNILVLLLGGGDKSTQNKDIEQTKVRWRKWKDANKEKK